jgi:hypothetical protein
MGFPQIDWKEFLIGFLNAIADFIPVWFKVMLGILSLLMLASAATPFYGVFSTKGHQIAMLKESKKQTRLLKQILEQKSKGE